MVVDDMRLTFLMIQKVLSPYPMEVFFVQDPRMALEKTIEIKPDLIILDYEMPHLQGPEVCKILRENSETKDSCIVMCTASSAAATINDSFSAGADDYVNKPIVEQEFLARVSRIFEISALKSSLVNRYNSQAAVSRILSHDLNNFMTVLKGSSNFLKRQVDLAAGALAVDEQSAKSIKRINDTVGRMENLLQNVRTLQSIDDGKMDLAVAPTKLGALLDEVILNFQERLAEKGIQIVRIGLPSQEVFEKKILCERISTLNSVLGNVISNAIKFSNRDGKLEIVIEDRNTHVIVNVRDHGVGMDSVLLGKLFSKSEKTTRPGTENEKGTGFGMPIIKMFMEKFGGDVNVTSTEASVDPQNHGTTVTLSFKKAS